jgi:hypothetical protein
VRLPGRSMSMEGKRGSGSPERKKKRKKKLS